MFDLPVVTKEQRRKANNYRLFLYDAGFSQIQLSVYAKYLVNATGIRPLLPRIKRDIPRGGAVRVLKITDEQWAGMYRYFGPKQLPPEERPTQLKLFDSEDADSQDYD